MAAGRWAWTIQELPAKANWNNPYLGQSFPILLNFVAFKFQVLGFLFSSLSANVGGLWELHRQQIELAEVAQGLPR